MEAKKKMEPFDGDEIGVKDFGKDLTKFIEENFDKLKNEPLNISLHADFGYGKTTFLRMWKNHLLNEGFSVIDINVWENDFYRNPALSFIYSFLDGLSESGLDKYGEIKKASLSLLKSIAYERGIQIIKNYTLINIGEIWKKIKTVFKPQEADLFKELKETKSSFESLKKSLKKIKVEKLPIIVLVDELDRCRPDYAIDILEIMKHLFFSSNIVFVCALNKDQIEKTVRKMFGEQINFHGYYKKFFNYEVQLPSIKGKLEEFIGSRLNRLNIDPKKKPQDYRDRIEYANYALSNFNLSLRDVDSFSLICDRVFKKNKNIGFADIDLTLFAVALFVKDKDFCKGHLRRKGPPTPMKAILHSLDGWNFIKKEESLIEIFNFTQRTLSFFYKDPKYQDGLGEFISELTWSSEEKNKLKDRLNSVAKEHHFSERLDKPVFTSVLKEIIHLAEEVK